MAASAKWEDLPVGVLGNIARRLHASADTVRFHAVCWAWRDALDEVQGATRLLPWLVAPSAAAPGGHVAEDQRCRCVFSKGTYLAPGICVRDRRVACADGASAWLVQQNGARLVYPLTADDLDYFPDECMSDEWLDRRHRIISAEGAVLLYDFDLNPPGFEFRFRGSFLYPDEDRWMPVSSNLGNTDRCCAASYYERGIVVCVDLANCHVLQPYRGDVRAALPEEPAGWVRRSSYLVECDGRLLLASVLHHEPSSSTNGSRLSVSLHELRLEKNNGGGVTVEWVRRDANDMSWLGEHALFLGFPGSFAMEATGFDGEVSGGTAYFVVEGGGQGSPVEPCSVYRYSFHDGTATLVDTLPPGWHDARCMWFVPGVKITVAPLQQHDEGSAPAAGDSGARRQQLTIYAGDLSPKVDNSRLRQMFSVYGKVASTRVAYDKRGRSRGFGFVTMETQEGFDKAMAALNPVKEEPDGSIVFDFIDLCLGLLLLFFIFAVLFYIVKGCKLFFLLFFSSSK